MDLFILVQKLDRHGTPLQQFNVPNQGAVMHDLTERGASVLRYKGSNGRLTSFGSASGRGAETDAVPAHSFDRVEKLNAGEIVDIEIDLLPIGLLFHSGEQLRLVIGAETSRTDHARDARLPFGQQGKTHHPHRRASSVVSAVARQIEIGATGKVYCGRWSVWTGAPTSKRSMMMPSAWPIMSQNLIMQGLNRLQ